jgi:hypothetical protein
MLAAELVNWIIGLLRWCESWSAAWSEVVPLMLYCSSDSPIGTMWQLSNTNLQYSIDSDRIVLLQNFADDLSISACLLYSVSSAIVLANIITNDRESPKHSLRSWQDGFVTILC